MESALKSRFILFLTFLYLLFLYRHLLEPGIPTGWDAPFHYLKTWVLANLLLPDRQLVGFTEYVNNGYVAFANYPPGFYYLVVGVHYVTLKYLSLLASFKAVLILIVLAQVFSVFILAKYLRFDDLTAAASALIYINIFSPPGLEPMGINWFNPINALSFAPVFGLGVAFVPVVVASYIRLLQKMPFSRSLFVSVLAVQIVVHPMTAFYSLLLIGMHAIIIGFGTDSFWRNNLWTIALLFLAIVMTSFWTLLFLNYLWVEPPQLFPFISFKLEHSASVLYHLISGRLMGIVVTLTGFLGMYRMIKTRGAKEVYVLIGIFIFTNLMLLPFSPLVSIFGIDKFLVRPLASFQAWRFQSVLYILWSIAVGVGCVYMLENSYSRLKISNTGARYLIFGGLIGLLLGGMTVPILLYSSASPALRTTSSLEEKQDIMKLYHWLEENTEEGTRVFFEQLDEFKDSDGINIEKTFRTVGSPHLLYSLLPIYSHRSTPIGMTLTENLAMGWIPPFSKHIHIWGKPFFRNFLETMGTRHIVSFNDETFEVLSVHKDIKISQRVGPFNVYEVENFHSPLVEASEGVIPVYTEKLDWTKLTVAEIMANSSGNFIWIRQSSDIPPSKRVLFYGKFELSDILEREEVLKVLENGGDAIMMETPEVVYNKEGYLLLSQKRDDIDFIDAEKLGKLKAPASKIDFDEMDVVGTINGLPVIATKKYLNGEIIYLGLDLPMLIISNFFKDRDDIAEESAKIFRNLFFRNKKSKEGLDIQKNGRGEYKISLTNFTSEGLLLKINYFPSWSANVRGEKLVPHVLSPSYMYFDLDKTGDFEMDVRSEIRVDYTGFYLGLLLFFLLFVYEFRESSNTL